MSSTSFMANMRRPIKGPHGEVGGPPQYTNWIDEEISWKESCYIGDWSLLTGCRFTGPDVLRLFADCSVNSMEKFAIGRSKHIIHCNPEGKIIEEGVLTRTGEQECIAYSTPWADHVRRNGDYDVEMEMIEEVKYHLQGPNALFVLEKVLGKKLRDIKFMRNDTGKIAGVETRILRQGMSGEIGFELQTPKDDDRAIWNAIVEAGQEYGIREIGTRVLSLNHLQAAYPTHGSDYLPAFFDDFGAAYREEWYAMYAGIEDYSMAVAGSFETDDIADYYRSPIEFGWGNRINFDHEFPGDEALRAELADPKRMLCTLRWNAEDIIDIYTSLFREGDLPEFMEMPQDPRGYMDCDQVLKDGEPIGASTSRGYSAHFREMISLAVLDIEQAEPGNELTVIWGAPGTPQREIRAIAAPAPYKEVRSRVDFNTLPEN